MKNDGIDLCFAGARAWAEKTPEEWARAGGPVRVPRQQREQREEMATGKRKRDARAGKGGERRAQAPRFRAGDPPRSAEVPGAGTAVALLALVGLACVLGFRETYSPDLGFHLSLGRWMAENRAFPYRDPLTFTLAEAPHVDLQWLYQLWSWGLYALGGTLSVVTGNVVLTLAALALALVRTRRALGRVPFSAAALLLPIVLGLGFEVRPHVLSWVLLAAVLLLLEEHRRGRPRVVWALPVLQLLWTNTHSLFVLGLVALGAHVLGGLLRTGRPDRPLWIAAGLCGLAAFANPNGWQGVLYPFEQLTMLQAGSVFKTEIGIRELVSPLDLAAYTDKRALVLFQPLLFVQAYLVLALVGGARRFRAADWSERLVLLLFAYVAWSGLKNFGYFAVATFPSVALGWSDLAAWLSIRLPRPRPGRGLRALFGWVPPALVVACCAVVVLQVRSGWLYAQERLPHRPGHTFNADFLPVRAAAFLNRGDVPEGRMLNTYADGGYLGFATRRKVFIDGRAELGGPEFFAAWAALTDPAAMREALSRHRVELAVVPYNEQPAWFRYFETDPAWRAVHFDARDGVYFHRGFAPGIPALPRPRPGVDYEPIAPGVERALLEAVGSRRDPGLLASLRGPHRFPLAEIRTSGSLLLRGHPRAALAVALAGLRDASFAAPELVVNAGHALWQLGRREEALRCYRVGLADPYLMRAAPELERALRALVGERERG